MEQRLTRRDFLKISALGTAGLAGTVAGSTAALSPGGGPFAPPQEPDLLALCKIPLQGTIPPVTADGFNPMEFLTKFDYGSASTLPDGRTLREYQVVAQDREIEVAPGVMFPAWTYNGHVPGPTLRATEGDLVRVHFTNQGSLPHTIHFHGFHPANMDGVFELVGPGQSFTYEFVAEPFGLHLYHCHVMPLKRHIHRGLYGTFIVDPKGGRSPAKELVMVMNGFDTNFDNENEFYAVNTVPLYYLHNSIPLRVNEPVRIYLVNLLEFDLINSMHTHATFFHFFRTGTKLEPDDFTDTIMLCQAERGVMEFSYRFPGKYMFHAHQSEFAELGWMGLFQVEG